MSTLCGAIIGDTHDPAGEALAIVAERRLSAAALLALLLADSKHRLVHEAQGMAEVRAAIDTHRPGVIVLDSAWSPHPSAMDVIPAEGDCRVLVLLGPDDDAGVFARAARANVHGYVSRSASRGTLEEAITRLRTSGWYMDPLLMWQVLSATSESGAPSPVAGPELSPRERQVLVGIASGQSTKEVAREYAIASKTVANHVNNIYQKLNLTHRGQLVLYAVQHGLTSL